MKHLVKRSDQEIPAYLLDKGNVAHLTSPSNRGQ